MPKKYKLAHLQDNSKQKNDYSYHKIHYQVYLQEDRPTHPKDEDEIEY